MKGFYEQVIVRLVLILAPVALLLGLSTLCVGACAALHPPQPCPPSQLAKLEAAYVAEATLACKLEGAHSVAECKAFPTIRDKYAAKRKDYVECQKP